MSIFYLPDLGEGLVEAEIREWYVKVGDHVTVDQPLLSVETAKALVEVPSPEAGEITKLYGKAGEIIKTHAPLLEFAGESKQDQGTVVGRLEQSTTIMDEKDVVIGAVKQTSTAIKVLPAVRALAKQLNIDLNTVQSTGPQGQITAEDVKKAAQKTIPADVDTEILHGVRHFMAIAMSQSHQEVVSVTIADDADITELDENSDITLCMINSMIAGAKAEPALNAWFDGKTMTRHLHHKIHLGLAVDTQEGLFVPVLKDITKKSPADLRTEINQLKQAARERTLTVDELQGATITLSNFGIFAGKYATLIVVPPMVAILGCGKIRHVAGVSQDKLTIRRILPLSLSFDHRSVTGGEATRFLAAVINDLERTRGS